MFGGSPISVAAPPMFDASTSAISIGTAETLSVCATAIVTGAISTTVVTLSRKADVTAVMAQSSSSTPIGLPPAAFAERIAIHWNTPVLAIVFAMIIMPVSRKITSRSIDSNACSVSITLSTTIVMPPARAAVVLCTRSEMMRA